jgi:serine/threonine-protein kinase
MALVALYFGAMALSVLLAWRNVRLGRGDRRGAFRLSLFIFVTRLLAWLFSAHHVAAGAEVPMFVQGLQSAVYWGALLGLLYLALEPFVRRLWPEKLISWSRLLAGDWRDPLVGRDFLLGGVSGVVVTFARELRALLPLLLRRPLPAPTLGSPLLYRMGLNGASGFLPLLANAIAGSLLFSLIILSIVLLFRMVTRRSAVAFGVSWLLLCAILTLNVAAASPIELVIALCLPTIFIVVLVRYGLLALVSTFLFVHLWAFFPATTNLSAWYAAPYLLYAALLAAMMMYAVRASLAGQALIARKVFE